MILNKGEWFALATGLSWSFSVIFFRLAGHNVGAIPLRVFSNFVTIALFIVSLLLLGEPLVPNINGFEWILLVVSAITGVTLSDTLYISALKRLGATGAGLFECLYSPLVIGIAFLFFGETISLQALIGGALVVSAVFIASLRPERGRAGGVVPLSGVVFAIGAHLMMAVTVVILRDVLRKESILTLSAYRFVIGNFVLMGSIYFTAKRKDLFVGFKKGMGLKWNVLGTIFGPFAATLLWFSGFKYTEAGRAAIFNQLSTVFIIVLAVVILKERLSLVKVLAILVALAGAMVVALS